MSQGGTLKRSKSRSGLSLRLSFSRSPKSPIPEAKDDSGANGFQELRKYIKQSAEFAKELTSILQERSELESSYAKGLSKISSRLAKVSKDAVGTLANAWIGVAMEIEQEAELHRSVAEFTEQEIAQPLKALNDKHTRSRKEIEAVVERTDKILSERRSEEFKTKKNSHVYNKELEKLQEQIHAVKLGKAKASSEKEVGKLQAKRHKLADATRSEEKLYHDCCVKSERARQDWEGVMLRSAGLLQSVEEERRRCLHETGNKLVNLLASVGPRYDMLTLKMREAMAKVDLNLDIQSVISERGTQPNIQEQILCDFYAEDRANPMNKERRVEALHKLVLIFTEDIQKELKSREGMGHLAQVYRDTPNFSTDESQMEVAEKLSQSESHLRFLQACNHKVCVALADVEGLEKPRHPLQRFMERERDKNNLPMTILRIPEWVARELKPDEQGNIMVSGPLPGSPLHNPLGERAGSSGGTPWPGSVGRKEGLRQSVYVQQHFRQDSQPGASSLPTKETKDQVDRGHSTVSSHMEAPPPYSEACKGRCRVLYEYQARMPDELTIYPGESILIHAKQSDGWWRGELNGKMGAFPACYVQEI